MKKNPAVVEYASPVLPRIFASMVYDSLLIAAISIGYGAFVVGLHVLFQGQPEPGQRIQWDMISSIFITLGWLAVIILFYVYFWQKFGQTLGMKTWRLQMIDSETGQLASYKKCVIRSFSAIISLLVFGFGYWFKLFHPQQKMLHDIMSGTQLILLKKK